MGERGGGGERGRERVERGGWRRRRREGWKREGEGRVEGERWWVELERGRVRRRVADGKEGREENMLMVGCR